MNATPGENGNGVSNGKGSFEWETSNPVSGTIEPYENYAYFNTKNADITQTKSSYDITFTYVDGQGCTNSATRTLDIVYLKAPSTTGYFGLSNWNFDVEVKAVKNGGDAIHWFADEISTMMKKGEGETWKTDDNPDKVIEKSYFARQYNATAGCYSEPTPADVKIVRCPIPVVVVDNVDNAIKIAKI